jgi:hypothetical protein
VIVTTHHAPNLLLVHDFLAEAKVYRYRCAQCIHEGYSCMIGSFSGIEAGLPVVGHLSTLQAAVFFVGMGIRFSFYLI